MKKQIIYVSGLLIFGLLHSVVAENRSVSAFQSGATCPPIFYAQANLQPITFSVVKEAKLDRAGLELLLKAPKAILSKLDIRSEVVTAQKGFTLLLREGVYLIFPGAIQDSEVTVRVDSIWFNPPYASGPAWTAYFCSCGQEVAANEDNCQFANDELEINSDGSYTVPPCGGRECCRVSFIAIALDGSSYVW
jgi:hypothetical protein